MSDIKPAIVVVCYNRPKSLIRILESIKSAEYTFNDICLIIRIVCSSIYEKLVEIVDSFDWTHGKKIIRIFDERQGLRKHVLQCGDLSEKYGAAIILEDDLIVSKSFYLFAYKAINHYYDDEKICGVALYSHSWNGYDNYQFLPVKNQFDAYLGQFSITWGECWSDKQWKKFKEWYTLHCDKLPQVNDKMPERISKWSQKSWGKYFASYIVEKDLYYLIPYNSMTTNFSDVGEHNAFISSAHQVNLFSGVKSDYYLPSIDQAIKYDSFFERIFDNDYLIANICSKNICVDLNNAKKNTFNNRYLLTGIKINNAKEIASFGMKMHPVDQNISCRVEGNDFHLYDVGNNYIIPKIQKNEMRNRIIYETYGLNWKCFFSLFFFHFRLAVKRKIDKLKKREK